MICMTAVWFANKDVKKQVTFNQTTIRIPFVPVHEQVHLQAMAHPDQTAVICSGEKMSYIELDRLSDRIAAGLIRKTDGRNDLIAVLFEREAAAYAAEIGVMKAGAAFIPLVPEYPDDRIDYCMKDSGSRLLLTTGKLRETRGFQETAYEVVTLEEILEDESRSGPGAAFPQVSEEDLAYCIYTSGTSGRPKGVLIEHRNIANYVHRNEKSIETMLFAKPGRISLAVAPFSFDFSLEEELVPLCSGNTVVIATNEQIHEPMKFADLVIQTGADAIACTPTYLLGLLAVHESREALKQIKLFHIGAEAFPKRLYSMLRDLRKDSVIMNVYGPTECTVISSSSIITDEEEITIGRPRANVQFYVLDPEGNELPAGQKGELIICGRQVARGYTVPDDSQGAFFTRRGDRAYHTGDLVSRTGSGGFMIHGRIDSQIKLRGYRIEPGEIESVMAESPEIFSAAAAVKEKDGKRYLVGYYTAAEKVDRLLLKRRMRTKLPDYMIPNVFIRIDRMPVSANGKLDRDALPEPDGKELQAQYVPPATEQGKRLCRAMEKVLRRPAHSVGLMDDFFDLSGDSVSAMELLAEADMEGLTYNDIFTYRTPAEILGELKRKAAGRQNTDIGRAERDARLVPHLLTPVQSELMEVQRMVPRGATVSSIRFLMRLDDSVDSHRFRNALNQVLAHHPGFAMRFFRDEENQWRQIYDPSLIPMAEIREIFPAEEDALAGGLIRPFEQLENCSLCRVNLFHGRKGLYFFMDVHHLLADGLSILPFFRNLADAYRGKELKPDSYPALLAMDEKGILAGQPEADRKYLHRRYNGYDWCIMPFTPDPACGERGATLRRPLRFDAGQVRKAAERLSVSFSVMHIASILLAMYRFTGKKDVMAFWTFHNRQTKGAEDAVGMFIKTLPVGCHMDEIQSVSDLLLSVKEQVVAGIAHSAYSYLVEEVFSRRIPWIESNIQLDIENTDMDCFNPEYIELQNAYPDTADNVMLAIISENETKKGQLDILFDRVGDGMRAADVECMHRKIYETLEAIVLGEPVDGLPMIIPGSAAY